MAPYDARAIANLLLDLGEERGVPLTQLSMLKLLYFCHGWYLATRGHPLSAHQFEAWEYGPVVRVVRESFEHFGDNPITGRAKRLDLNTGLYVDIPESLTVEDRQFVRDVFRMYAGYSASELVEMSHEKGSPWDQIWNSDSVVVRLGLRLKDEEIRQHFLKKARAQRIV